ncbi:hypothetical protein VCCP1047_1412, partial [Vibrio cholerae CP1047(20)]
MIEVHRQRRQYF